MRAPRRASISGLAPSIRSFAIGRALGWLNVGAVGFALAACTAATLGLMFPALAVGVPTLCLGLVWAYVLRQRWTWPWPAIRVGWVAAAPLASLNAGLAFAIVQAVEHGRLTEALLSFVYGATVGAILWLPALVATLVAFGLPMLHAQTLAKRGLADGERGEAFVGQVCIVLSLFAFARGANSLKMDDVHHLFTLGTAVVGGAFGVTSWVVAAARERRRRGFLASVERGELPSYRVDVLPEGKVLVRLSPEHGTDAYRMSFVREEICLLDAEGRATEPRGDASNAS